MNENKIFERIERELVKLYDPSDWDCHFQIVEKVCLSYDINPEDFVKWFNESRRQHYFNCHSSI